MMSTHDTASGNSSSASVDWLPFTVSAFRMDPVNALFSASLNPAIGRCASFKDLHQLQRGLYAVITCPYVSQFPLRAAYVYSLLKLVVSASETAAKQIDRRAQSQAPTAGEEDEQEEDSTEAVCEELLEVYLDYATATSATSGGAGFGSGNVAKNEAETFYTSSLALPLAEAAAADAESSSATATTSFLADNAVMGRFVPMRCTSAFVNVGLAVWPAAHITIDLLATLAEGGRVGAEERIRAWLPTASQGLRAALVAVSSSAPSSSPSAPLRVLELGAGVGLTPAVLHKRYTHVSPRKQHAANHAMTITVTDYQPNILDNCTHNLAANGCPYVQVKDSAALAAAAASSSPNVGACGSSTDHQVSNVSAIVAPLDWNERDETRQVVAAVRPQIAIAADCIYDRSVLDGLSETLRDALAAPTDGIGGSGCVPIIIQTHRNDATQTELHEKLNAFADVYSFHYDAERHWLVPLEGVAWRAGSKPIANPSAGQCIQLLKCGVWRVEMSDIMFVHFLWPKNEE